MICNKKYIMSMVVAFLGGYACATYFHLNKQAKKEDNTIKEYVFLGNEKEVYKGEDIDYSIYANGVDPNGVYNKSNGVIPNDSLAVEMAKLVLFPIYGKEEIENQKPYKVTLINNELWSISGSLPQNTEGGTFFITISKLDGRVCMISHEK